MSGTVYAVMTLDPITGKPNGMQADIDWNLGTAAVIAESVHGVVVQAPRGEWAVTPQEEVDAALELSKQATMDEELQKMLGEAGAP